MTVHAKYASCCVLSFERPGLLRRSIESLTFAPGAAFELIIHDDGSSRPEVYEVLEWARLAKGATVIMNPAGHNQGVGVAVNRMFSIATGDPLVKLDQDLEYYPGWLAEMVAIIERNKTASDEPDIGTLGGFRYHHEPCDYDQMVVAEHPRWVQVSDYVSSALMVRRAIYDLFGPWETHSEAFAEDIAFKQRLYKVGFAHALPKEDVMENVGFGIPSSTVVLAEGQVRPIHNHPLIRS